MSKYGLSFCNIVNELVYFAITHQNQVITKNTTPSSRYLKCDSLRKNGVYIVMLSTPFATAVQIIWNIHFDLVRSPLSGHCFLINPRTPRISGISHHKESRLRLSHILWIIHWASKNDNQTKILMPISWPKKITFREILLENHTWSKNKSSTFVDINSITIVKMVISIFRVLNYFFCIQLWDLLLKYFNTYLIVVYFIFIFPEKWTSDLLSEGEISCQ